MKNNDFSPWWFSCGQFHGKHPGALLLDRVFHFWNFELLEVCYLYLESSSASRK